MCSICCMAFCRIISLDGTKGVASAEPNQFSRSQPISDINKHVNTERVHWPS